MDGGGEKNKFGLFAIRSFLSISVKCHEPERQQPNELNKKNTNEERNFRRQQSWQRKRSKSESYWYFIQENRNRYEMYKQIENMQQKMAFYTQVHTHSETKEWTEARKLQQHCGKRNSLSNALRSNFGLSNVQMWENIIRLRVASLHILFSLPYRFRCGCSSNREWKSTAHIENSAKRHKRCF